MQIDINVKTYSTKQRMLAFFMAFLIFTMTCPEILDGLGAGLIARAADIILNTKMTTVVDTSKTFSSSHSGQGVTNTAGATLNYKYTGKIKNARVNLYDYLSDEEVNGQAITQSTVSGYSDPYPIFNGAISKEAISPASDNITIVFEDFGGSFSDHKLSIYLEKGSGSSQQSNGWPGVRMRYDGGKFKYTFSVTQLGFIPDRIKFTNGSDTRPDSNPGSGYTFSDYYKGNGDTDGYKRDHTYYVKFNERKIYEASGSTSVTYRVPLYFGCFLRTDAKDPNGNGSADNPNSYQGYNTPSSYNNFYWQANLAFRKGTWNSSQGKYILSDTDASVLGLVDATLDANGNLTQDGNILPYFSSAWANNHKYNSSNGTYSSSGTKEIMNCYEGSGEQIISFPFYEVLVQNDGGTGSSNIVKNITSGLASGEYARFYQFNSEDTNLYFHANNETPSLSYFSESVPKIKSSAGLDGYFPFNSSNSENGKANNLGFGSKFEMNFKLSSDGTVEPVDSSGEKIKTSDNRLHTMFEFTGDDDLWVFVDGNLLLDMGGAHAKSSGLIDFYIGTQTATVNSGRVFNAASGNNLNVDGSTQKISNSETYITGKYFRNILKEGSYTNANGYTIANADANDNVTQTKYNTEVTHTMTIFYMERGMLDSNLLIRFNYALEANFSKMKVQEQTDFSTVNPGLRDLTRKAAENDVFKYTVANAGTADADVKSSLIYYPTYDKYDRTVASLSDIHYPTTTLTSKTLEYTNVSDEDSIYLDLNGINWNSSGAKIAAWIYNSSEDVGTLILGTQAYKNGVLQNNVFKFSNLPTGTEVRFLRIRSDKSFANGSSRKPVKTNQEDCWNWSNTLSFTKNHVYQISGWDNTGADLGENTTYSDRMIKYNYDSAATSGGELFKPSTSAAFGTATYGDNTAKRVENVNYLWVDGLATQDTTANDGKSDDIIGMTGRTNGSGELYLMHGLKSVTDYVSSKESSAEFERQFKRNSQMVITQHEDLYQPNRETTPATLSTSTSARQMRTTSTSAARKVSDYYNTSVLVFDRGAHETYPTTVVADNSDIVTDFTFNNDVSIDSSWAVMMTEVFTNTVNVGAITVEKQIKSRTGGSNIEEDTNEVFTFRIQFRKIFGVEGISPTSYNNIVAHRFNSDNTQDDTFTEFTNVNIDNTDYYGEFTLKRGQKLTINQIPVGTEYLITELANVNYEQYSTSNGDFEPIVQGDLNNDHLAVDGSDIVVANRNETIVNVRKVGTLTLNKVVTGNASTNIFTFTGTLTGAEHIDLRNYAISGTGVTLGTYNPSTRTYTFTARVTAGTETQITGIPYGTSYTVTEALPGGATSRSIAGDHSTIDTSTVTASGTIDNTNPAHPVTVTNVYPEYTSVSIQKQDSSGNGLAGAVYELWYKEKDNPPTYSFNPPQVVPYKMNGMTISGTPDTVGVPELATNTKKITTYTYTETYSNPDVPSSSDTDWILPRNDSDYIYFRDYNIGITGWEDKTSFNNTAMAPANNNGDDGKRSWRGTEFGHHNGHDQDLELFFDDNDSYWMAAEFSGTGKQTVRYAMWERFVDEYSSKQTVVWKIQPPDGYTTVKFMMLDGDTVIRETSSITYELGKIYHKTEWGKWTSRNGKDVYYDVPIADEGYWAPNSNTVKDKRYNNSGMDQARKYEPTDQKIIFHCSSNVVWHNIHIEFFNSNSVSDPVNGQPFPGYMMEPYAYAGSDYRVGNYLTYELTIPKGAKYFRINNGVDSGSYNYMTGLVAIKDGSDASNGQGKKNYGNYYEINTRSGNTFTLKNWTPAKEEGNVTNQIPDKTYIENIVDSDYDYIYFNKPSDWDDHVYAYFYGGGDLRNDNWQRAAYSAWPGVAAVGTEYTDKDKNGSVITDGTHHSTTYTYSTTGGDEYNGTGTSSISSPETIFDGTVYKFRIPKGDRTNYSKVIFNDGLKKYVSADVPVNGKTHETGIIAYEPGYLYNADGSCSKHYENSPTYNYTKRSGGNYEYVYVKVKDSDLSTWDDLHITFYAEDGTQILQQGVGYVMDYAGKQSDGSPAVDYTYFRVPIPTDAKQFSVNNGIGRSHVTGKYDIERLNTSTGKPKDTVDNVDKFVYELKTGDTLTRCGKTQTPVSSTSETAQAQSEVTTGYNVRQSTSGKDDTLNICDTAGWNVPVGGVSVRFYDSNGTVMGSNPYTYTMMNTDPDENGHVWYTKKIPDDAKAFSVSYTKSSSTYNTAKYPIYSTSADPNGNVTSSGHMFYETSGNDVLVMTHSESVSAGADDVTYSKRGDYLYLCYSDNTTWADMKVNFYADGNSTIIQTVTPEYINAKDGMHWYKAAIPSEARAFTVSRTGGPTASARIYELKDKIARYQKDYTLGDMQYKLPSAANGTPELLYPVFTEDTEYTTTLGGETLSSRTGIPQVNSSVVENYAVASEYTLPVNNGTLPAAEPILYNTGNAGDTVSYSWSDGSNATLANTRIWFDNSHNPFNNESATPYAYFFTGSVNDGQAWPGHAMTYDSTKNLWYYDIPDGANYSSVIFSNNGDNQIDYKNKLNPDNYYGRSYVYHPSYEQTTGFSSTYLYVSFEANENWEGYVYFWNSSNQPLVGAYPGKLLNNYSNGGSNLNNTKCYKIAVPDGAVGVKVRYRCDTKNGGDYVETSDVTLQTALWADGKNGIICPDNGGSVTTWVKASTTTIAASFEGPELNYGTPITPSASYQPEDRYGMISDINGTSPATAGSDDVNNFIKITTAIDNPYIMFYSNDDATATIGGNNMATAGISLTKADQDGTEGNPYMIRLPKNARAFVISSGYATTPNTSKKQLLYSNTVTTTVGSGSDVSNVTVPYTYHHAGTTFSVDSDCNVSVYSLRSGFTVFKNAAMTDPLVPKTDYDYIYFTDVNNQFADNGTVYAYFYGGADGQFNAWPGVKASTTTDSGKVDTTYKDNDGNTVYVFRMPKNENGDFKKVVFNNGKVAALERKITEAMNLTAGTNYKLTSVNVEGHEVYTGVQQYGSFAPQGKVYLITADAKAESATAAYNTGGSNNYIYVTNNGTYGFEQNDDMDSNGRYILDDIHVEFFDAIDSPIGTANPGYIPEKVGANVYRIQVPSDAVTFRINNGQKKGNENNNTHNHYRYSEKTEIIPDALYQFVTESPYVVGTEPSSIITLDDPAYKLTITNKITPPVTEEELPDGNYVDVHLATVITKAGGNGAVEKIIWLKDDPNHIDTKYLQHSTGDINNTSVTNVNVKKQGEYYWKEIVAPSGYAKDTTIHSFSIPLGSTPNTQTFTDSANPVGQLTLSKKLETAKKEGSNYGEGKSFTFTITMTAPAGTNWTFVTQPACSSGGTLTVTNTNGIVRTYELTVPATATNITISNIPYGTFYNITENAESDYSWVSTYKGNDTTTNIAEPVIGEIKASDHQPSYHFTNKHDVGMLTLKDIVIDNGINALAHAEVNQDTILNTTPDNTTVTNWYTYDYLVTLEAPADVDLNDYISKNDLDAISGKYTPSVDPDDSSKVKYSYTSYPDPADSTNVVYTARNDSENSKYTFHVYVTSADDGFKQIKNIPLGTKYTVIEQDPLDTHDGSHTGAKSGVKWSKSGDVTEEDNKFVNAANKAPTETITNLYSWADSPKGNEVILTKTAKEKVGTKDIGDPLAGAKFLVKKASDDLLVGTFSENTLASSKSYTFGSGTFNTVTNYLETGEDGKLHIKGLPYGDYYLEEQAAPNGYSHLDSNTGTNKKVYFSVGENREVKEISATDEMAPAYIKLFEHIDMKKEAWGDPTFIFKIKQTGYYKNDGTSDIQTIDNGKEILVALTVNDDGTVTTDNVLGSAYNGWYQESTDEQTTVNSQTVREYQGMYDIDSQGRIRVEPGTYSISRVPVSRYEFVADTWKLESDNTANIYTTRKQTEQDKMTGITIPKGKTADIHYYDKVAYYDKFSQVKEAVNQFYTLDANKANKTIKGIRVEDYKVDTVSTTDMDSVGGNGTLTTLSLQQSRRFKAYYIYADGTESQITDTTELAKFVISYEYDDTSGDDDRFGYQTNAADNDFQYNTETDVITVANYADRYKNGVYTLKATYDGKFSANFDIVFERS